MESRENRLREEMHFLNLKEIFMHLNKKLFIVGIIGSVLCFAGDMLLGCFTPSKEFGNSRIFPPFSDDWAN